MVRLNSGIFMIQSLATLYKPCLISTHLVEWVGAGAPVCQEERKADSFEDTGNCANGNGVEWALLSEDLRDDLDGVSITAYITFTAWSLPMEQQRRRR